MEESIIMTHNIHQEDEENAIKKKLLNKIEVLEFKIKILEKERN